MATSVFGQKTEGTYTFASQPRALQPQRKKYRFSNNNNGSADAEAQVFYGNIMYDRRVVRGNTYAQHALPISAYVDPVEVQKQKEMRRREVAKKRAKQLLRTKSPEPVEGRKHIEMQTELYLEELTDHVEETEVECQTDAFLDRPPSPLFIPAKSGIDKETQILEGELFDFDVEVRPILEVLVGKTVEQALMEVMEEEELANLRQQQQAFEELRNGELMEQQRLEEQDRRHREEKERRMRQQQEVQKLEKETAARIAARAFAHSYLADLVPSVFGTLASNGYFYDPVEREVEKSFLPWLLESTEKQLSKIMKSREILDGLLQEIVNQRQVLFSELELRARAAAVVIPEPELVVVLEQISNEEDTASVKAEPNGEDEVLAEGQEELADANTEEAAQLSGEEDKEDE